MKRLLPVTLRPWTLPLIVAALIGPPIAGFALAGPQLGLALGALAAGSLLVLAGRLSYDEEIEVAGPRDGRYRVLVVASGAIEDPEVVEQIAGIAADGWSSRASPADGEPQLLVVAPARSGVLDRWASDLRPARELAQRALAVSLASLAKAGLDAAGRVGDGDPVQAVEDELREFAAQEVVLVDGPGLGPDEVDEVRRRLDRPVRELRPRALGSA